MKKQSIKKNVEIFMFIGFVMAWLITVPLYAQETMGGGYEFGPGLAQTTSDEVNLRVPARTNVGIVVALQRNLTDSRGIPVTTDVNVNIEVIKPDGTTAMSQTASATVVGAGLQVPSISFPGVFSSQRGCPDTWRVRIRSSSNTAPPVRVFGTVTFAFLKPGTVNLGMEGGTLNLDGNSSATKTLTGHDLTGDNRALIAGTGTIRIRAKWHTDPIDVFNFGKFFRLTVALIRPNNTVAASETGFSQHAPSGSTPKIDFSYTVTAQDALMTGSWKLRVTSPSGNPRIVNFDVERGLDINSPSFNSTFNAQCSSPVGVS
jgi:hypothetical protein